MKEYNEKTHAKRLLGMLEQDTDRHDLGYACPASKGYRIGHGFIRDKPEDEVCVVCLEFIGLDRSNLGHSCPCDELGCNKAIEASWCALETKGYI